MHPNFASLLIFLLLSTLVISGDHKPWYRTKSSHEHKLAKEQMKKNEIEHHQEQTVQQKKRVQSINWQLEKFKEERKHIPPGSALQKELKSKIHEIKEAEASTRRQKLAYYLFQRTHQNVSHALWQNVVNAPQNHQKLQKEFAKLKSQNYIYDYHPYIIKSDREDYEHKNCYLHSEKIYHEKKLEEQKQKLEKLQSKKSLFSWKSFPGQKKRDSRISLN